MLKSRFNNKLIFFSVAGLITTYLISLALLQVFAFLVFILWIFEKQKSAANDPIYYGFLLFGLVRLISVFTSEYFDASIVTIQKELLFYLALTALYFYVKTFTKEKNIELIKIFIHAAAVAALIGLVLYSLGKFDRAQSFGSGYATYSTYLLTALMFALTFHPFAKKGRDFWIWALEIGLILSGIILSMGRANIAIALVLTLFIIFLRKISLKEIGAAVIFTFLITFLSLQFNPGESASRINNPTTLSDRDILYEGFYDLAADHPLLGFGPRTFHQIFPYKERLADKEVGSWHNDYIQIYLESGIFAIFLFIGILVFMMHKTKWIIFKPKKLMEIEESKFAIIFSLIAICGAGLTGTFFLSPVLSLLFAYIVSLFSIFWYIKT